MKPDNFIEALSKFFLDIIGTIIPGIALILGFWIILDKPNLGISISFLSLNDISSWALLIIAGYVLGYGVTSFSEVIILPVLEWIISNIPLHRLVKSMIPRKQLIEEIHERTDFKSMVSKAKEILELDPIKEEDFKFWRNMALAITQENNSLVYRFTSISLLNLGVATDFIILAFFWCVFAFMKHINVVSIVIPINFSIIGILIFFAFFFLERYYQFNRRAMQIPFSLALIKLQEFKRDASKQSQ
jgi:hypothetical protein